MEAQLVIQERGDGHEETCPRSNSAKECANAVGSSFTRIAPFSVSSITAGPMIDVDAGYVTSAKLIMRPSWPIASFGLSLFVVSGQNCGDRTD